MIHDTLSHDIYNSPYMVVTLNHPSAYIKNKKSYIYRGGCLGFHIIYKYIITGRSS
jgi:hypothetical protein